MSVRKSKTSRRRRTKLTWRNARRLKLHRVSPCGIYDELIDPGVNFFVAALEMLGAVPRYSCEGHPTNFYVLFDAPMCLAAKILDAGFFTVELENLNQWSIRLPRVTCEDERVKVLDWAAKSWSEKLGPFYVEDVQREHPLQNV